MNENKNAPDGSREQKNISLSLTEHELYCIAKHLQVHVVKGIIHEDEKCRERLSPCGKCKLTKTGMAGCPFTEHVFVRFRKLASFVNVDISACRGFSDND